MMFVDLGLGRNEADSHNVGLASVGFGADLRLGSIIVASFAFSRPLINATVTRAGDRHVDARLTIAY